ncbi:hypothetical protein CPLU01_01364 [Colletotrichum plurivorum]|uniref:Uncharacterized protein n=1 Tax=Colletotrichum plurivorum TaxID=2175906 RepID=A0A8H6NPB2_9PEZI|nr:hypothetical protein CPLU01_01364 [Colletotrichum plurivorum]
MRVCCRGRRLHGEMIPSLRARDDSVETLRRDPLNERRPPAGTESYEDAAAPLPEELGLDVKRDWGGP